MYGHQKDNTDHSASSAMCHLMCDPTISAGHMHAVLFDLAVSALLLQWDGTSWHPYKRNSSLLR